MIPTFVIFLREGIEASMIVAILLSYLNQINKREHFRDVFLGVGAAFALILGGGIAAYIAISNYENSNFKTYWTSATVFCQRYKRCQHAKPCYFLAVSKN